jgi:putative pyoverdin transport system ATP-binding/permease protein
MSFLQLLRREMHGSLARLVVISGLGGASNAAILAAVNSGAQYGGGGQVSLVSAGLFLIALFVFIKTQQYILISATVEIEAIIHRLRVRLMDQVRRSELLALDAIGRAGIVTTITRETATLTQATNTLAFAAQGAILVVFVGLYIAYLSLLALGLTIVIIGTAALVFHAQSGKIAKGNREAAEWDNRLFDRLIDLLDGFKEVRLNRARSDDLFDDIVEVSRAAANLKIRTQAETFRRLVFSQSSMYILLGAIVFVSPVFGDAQPETLAKTTTATLFAVGACFGLVNSIPILTAANAAADNIDRLEAELQRAAAGGAFVAAPPLTRFKKIEVRKVVFRYVDKLSQALFQVGPVDFTLQPGELVFITGGNGSGKSTFLRILAGLYHPETGEILLDGVLLNDRTRDAYRSLFSAIFIDSHLFQRLYGIADSDPAEIDRLLAKFRLDDKTHVADGEFSTIDLSGGQRKRIALIVSLLEKRPILLLDEWTAEQDPEFRRKFYDELLPELMRAGATIVAITHDDRYLAELHLPARRLRMDEGRIVEQRYVEAH